MKFSTTDISYLQQFGISEETVQSQMDKIIQGPAPVMIQAACTPNEGIIVLPQEEWKQLENQFEKRVENKKVYRFIPASGAATRMFKDIAAGQPWNKKAELFFEHLPSFAFYSKLMQKAGVNASKKQLVDSLLWKSGLNASFLPKALIDFHIYATEIRTAILDQLVEGVKYHTSSNEVCFHFTVSEHHLPLVEKEVNKQIQFHEKLRDFSIQVDYSIQKPNTNTVALNRQNELVRNEQGDILLRPGGHGTLIHNLNEVNADIVIIKNIDNIAHEDHQQVVVDHKKSLISYGVTVQKQVFEVLQELQKKSVVEPAQKLAERLFGVKKKLNLAELIAFFDRPLRVAGMVKNEGQPGGGPFWVNGQMEIVEGAQMNVNDPNIQDILSKSTHFNPVDIVCFLTKENGQKFNLLEYVNHDLFFTSKKMVNGNEVTILEYPGLWNGAMSNWLTLFVEVPEATFNPVKTVVDLLNPAHMPKS